MTIFNKIKLVWDVFMGAGKIEQNQKILQCQEKLLEKQKRIEELEIENKELKNELEAKNNHVMANQFKKINHQKNSCK